MSHGSLIKFPELSTPPVEGPPAGWTIVAGDPIAQSWRLYTGENERQLAGQWRCTPGTFRVSYSKWEYCHVLSGMCVITRDGGTAVQLTAGDSFIVEKGFEGTWEVIETMEKHFVFVAEA